MEVLEVLLYAKSKAYLGGWIMFGLTGFEAFIVIALVAMAVGRSASEKVKIQLLQKQTDMLWQLVPEHQKESMVWAEYQDGNN